MAKARPIRGLAPDTRFGDAAAAAVDTRAREVFEHADGVLDTGDIERVHDMRVATRRLRAALEVFSACFPKKEHKAVLKEVKRLADALGERRDPDVAIASLESLASELGTAERPGVEGLVAELRADQEAGNQAVARALEEAQAGGLAERLEALALTARREEAPA